MITVLTKLFIKNQEDIKSNAVRGAYGTLCSIVGICLNIILFIIKLIAGLLSGSVAITADSVNNLSDAGSSVITLLGFKLSGKKADADHPFGHGRIEYVSGLIVSMLILLMGFELGKSSLDKIIHPEPLDNTYFILTVIILAVSILVKVYMWYYNKQIGKKIDSAAMTATAADSLSDSVSTFVVLVCTVLSEVFGWQLDGFAGIAVALFIFYTGINSARETLNPLLGKKPDGEVVEAIENIVMAHDEIEGIHDMVLHDYGPGRFFVSLHAEVDGEKNIYDLHDCIDVIEQELASQFDCIPTVHMDPIDVNNPQLRQAKDVIIQMVKDIDESFSIHDLRLVPGVTHTNYIFDIVVPFGVKMTNDEIKDRVAAEMQTRFENSYAVFKIDRDYV